jgi:formate dehydrogenase major subunit
VNDDPAPADATVRRPKDHAAGVPAVLSSMNHALRQMGPRRTALTLTALNQRDGFDCPGCAWPDPGHRSRAEFCENGVKAVAEEATKARADRAFWARHSLAELDSWTDHQLGKAGRITEPMVLRDGDTHYRPISWDDAFALVADRLAAGTPDQAVFYTSGRTSNEAAFLYQLLVRRFGTNNLPDCSNMCHESSGAALNQTIGVGKGSVTLEDVHAADLILVVGQNPGTNHPRMLSALAEAKRRGGRVIAVNPLPEAGLKNFRDPKSVRGVSGLGQEMADEYVQVRVNGDLALFQALNRRLVELDALDHDFITEHTAGLGALREHLLGLDPATLANAAGVGLAQIERVAEMVRGSARVIVCWAMGLTQHRNAVATIREVVNFLLLRGNIGRPGAGVCPVRGHSNVQGDRTMGIHEKPAADFLDRIQARFGFDPPRDHGYDTVAAITAMAAGRVRVFVGMGGNFAAATPDTAVTEKALRTLDLTVQVSTKPNRSHVVHGREALILPVLGRTEIDEQDGARQFVTVEDSMSVVHPSHGALAPASPDLRSEVAVVCGLAEAIWPDGGADDIPWSRFRRDYGLIRDAIADVVTGFDRFAERLHEEGEFTLVHPVRDRRVFPTASGKAELTVNHLVTVEVPPGRLLLQTLRSHDQYNTTVYGLHDRYRGISNARRVVLVNPDDLRDLGLGDGQVVDLVGEHPDGERRAPGFRVVAYPTARGCAASYFPETNVLVPLDAVAADSNTPASKSIVVRLEPA